jgi:NADH-quinone oxidoreductase subunit H
MLTALQTLMLTAPDWVSQSLTRETHGDKFWANYVVWPLIQILIVLFVILTLVAYLVYLERKVSAFMQARLGPMRVGPWGLLQPAADGLKLLLKEDIIPIKADKAVFELAPVITVVAALVVLAVVPWGPSWGTIANVNIGLLFVLAVSSVSVLGLVLSGWSSNSKYSLLGALRSSAQMVSYEVGMGLSIIGALMFARTLSMSGIIDAQAADHHVWYVFFQPMGFIIYIICALGETNRAPFDLPEAESELVAGYHTEYSGFRWALFFMAEYTGMIVTSAIAVTLFLGGWSLFGLESVVHEPTLKVLVGIVIFAAKILVVIYATMWFRWTFPRYRYDQLMDLGWKWLIPAGLANIVLTGIWYVLALPDDQGGVFGFIKMGTGRSSMTWGGVVYFVATGFLVTVPLVWLVLATINRHSRDFNLRTQRQLQMEKRQERLQTIEPAAPAPQ